MRRYRKILHISYVDHVTSVEVCNWIQHATRSHEDLLTTVKRQKLQWFVHVSGSSGLAKIILQALWRMHKEGWRQRGWRQRKRWEDNVRDWTGMDFPDSQSQRAVADTESETDRDGGSYRDCCEIIGCAPTTLRINRHCGILLLYRGHKLMCTQLWRRK